MRPCYGGVKHQPYGTVRKMSSPDAALMDPPARPRALGRDERRQAILAIARESFMEHGFAATSMSAIAARLGGSKGTLYNYFPSKEQLFAAMVAEECQVEAAALTLFQPTESLEESLVRFGEWLMGFMLSDKALALHRVISSEVVRFPELGRLFYEAGPAVTQARVAEFLAERMAAGVIRRSDPLRAAAFLTGLFKSNLHNRRIWGVLEPMDSAAISAHVAEAVRVFLQGYAPAAG